MCWNEQWPGRIQGEDGIKMTIPPVNIDFILMHVWFTDPLLSVKLHYPSWFLKDFFKISAFLLKQLNGKTKEIGYWLITCELALFIIF